MELTGNQKAIGRLRVACERAKRILSSTTETSIELDCLHDGIYFSTNFTRSKFEDLNMSMFDSCLKILDKCLRDASMDKSRVDEIVLVGGSTRIPKVQSMLKEYFNGKELCKSVNPDEAVAYGAAIMATKLSGSSTSVSDLVLMDVTPLSLGIELRGCIVDVVIPRNTPIPTKKSKFYYTNYDYQTEVTLKVYQGERARCIDNHLLGKFVIFGFPPASTEYSKFKTCFDIDRNGILTVTAKILSTGKTEKLTITNENGSLSMLQIEKMMRIGATYVRSNTFTGVPYTEDEIMVIVRGSKQRGHIPGVGRVLPGQGTVIPPSPPCTHSSDAAKIKKSEKRLTKQVKMFMKLFRRDDKFSQMLTQLESLPEYDGVSGSGGCGGLMRPEDDKDGERGWL
ncbi:putative heat shock protein 70 family protein [Tanacetum coccineum]